MQEITIGNVPQLEGNIKEAYKTLKTNISFCGRFIRVILVTSTIPHEGKTFVSFNLATNLAKDKNHVLFIDADLRDSAFTKNYDVSSAVPLYGLSHYLVKQAKKSDITYHTNIHNLDIILSGPSSPNPTELLEEESFSYLMDSLRLEYDYIIIDTPPLGRVIDAAILSSTADGAIMVIEKDKLSYKLALNVKKQLEKTNCRLLGAVLNKSDNVNHNYYKKDEYE